MSSNYESELSLYECSDRGSNNEYSYLLSKSPLCRRELGFESRSSEFELTSHKLQFSVSAVERSITWFAENVAVSAVKRLFGDFHRQVALIWYLVSSKSPLISLVDGFSVASSLSDWMFWRLNNLVLLDNFTKLSFLSHSISTWPFLRSIRMWYLVHYNALWIYIFQNINSWEWGKR